MVLKHLELKRFKCWRALSLDFSPGLNVILGPNESGKTTLRAALMAVLFGNPTSQSEVVERWKSWGEAERCELKLEYADRGGLACQLRKDFTDHKVFLIKGEESFKTAKLIQQ
ncbi:MAG: AAA family ATPase, partial [Candidatus Firestonebacteria bacterium]|nr:AAA family ATPase [Candidatus Firestonebacteria bacterium]